MHGSTVWRDGDFKPRRAHEIAPLIEWGTSVIVGRRDPREISKIELNALPSSAARHYWKTTLTAFEYGRDEVPDDEVLMSDLQHMLEHLASLYARVESDPLMPGVESAEITLAIEAIAEAQGRDSPLHHGQGFRINKLEQRAVERHAVDLATAHWQSLGWTVHDVGATKSYDLHCTRGDAVLYVEVKGTTSTGDKILLTRNEVALHRDTYPDNALVVVSQISLNRDAEAPSASGGQIHVLAPWELDTERLSPIAYEFTVGRIS